MDEKNMIQIEQLSQSMHDADWFAAYRQQAFALLTELAAPKIERLDYASWNLFEPLPEEEMFGAIIHPEKQTITRPTDYIQRSSGLLEQIGSLHDEIEIVSFTEAFADDNQAFRQAYSESEFINLKDQLNAFNLAYLTSGIYIRIPKGVTVTRPLNLAFLNEKIQANTHNHQVFIVAEANTEIEIIESYSSTGQLQTPTKLNVHVHIQAGPGARIKYTAIDELDDQTRAFFRRTGQTAADATLDMALGMMSDGHVIEDIQIDLVGQGSTADVKVVAISHTDQVQVANTKVINHGANTVGNIYQHGVVLDQATLTFNGVGDVVKNAKYSDAQQESRILMLSEDARADTNPILLIDEYELTAGHAASVSRVDEMQLYYLMSRGLGRTEAEKLVIRGFLGSVLAAISVKEVQADFIETIERKLNLL